MGLSPTLSILEEMFNPNNTHLQDIRDAVVVSLDLEYESSPPQIHQIGLSVLDTRHLAKIDVHDPRSVAFSASSHLFLPRKRRCRAYCYGEPILVEHMGLDEVLRPFLEISGDKGQYRHVVLVGHSIHNDLSMLEKCGLDLNGLTQIRACIDIALTCTHFFDDITHIMSLKHICQRLEIRTMSFHNAAHDALYTLQALLKLFCLYKDEKLPSSDSIMQTPQDKTEANRMRCWDCLFEILRFLGQELGNGLWTGSAKNRRKKQQREDYIRHLQSGSSLNTVARLRSERKEKRSSCEIFSYGGASYNRLEEIDRIHQ